MVATPILGSLLPNGLQQFVDGSGVPYNNGTVEFFIPGTTTHKATWSDPAETLLNSNPVVLDGNGRALIYGSGQYRQVLKDRCGNLVWDQLTYGNVPLAFPSIAALRANAIVMVPGGSAVDVLGYSAPGDGGEGWFVYVATDTTSADNGGTIIVDTLNQRWYRQLAGNSAEGMNVCWFGASPLAADNTAAFNLAFAALNVGPGGKILVPAGTYTFTGTPTWAFAEGVSVALIGAGIGVTQLLWTGDINGIVVTYAPLLAYGGIDVFTGFTVQGISFLTQVVSTHTALTINGNFLSGYIVGTTQIRDAEFRGQVETNHQWGTCVLFNAVAQTSLTNVGMYGKTATHTMVGASYVGSSTAIATVHTLVGVQVFFADKAWLFNNAIQGATFTGCNATDVNYGLYALGTPLFLANPAVQQLSMTLSQVAAHHNAVFIQAATDCSFVGNFFFTLGNAGNESIVLLDSCFRMQIVGNDFVGFDTTTQVGIGWLNTQSLTQTLDPSIVIGNTFNNIAVAVEGGVGSTGLFSGINAYGSVTLSYSDSGSNTAITKGANDSGGTGFAYLRVPNAWQV